jgi:hypothetical protein
MKLFIGLAGGFILSILGAIVVTIVSASFPPTDSVFNGALTFFILWLIAILVTLRTKSLAKSLQRLLIASAIFSFLLPFVGLFYTSTKVSSILGSGDEYFNASAISTSILGTILSGFMSVVGVSMGIFFLLISLLISKFNKKAKRKLI